MTVIAICDDNLYIRDTVSDIVKGYGAENHLDFEFIFFNNPKEMMEYPGNFQILFLDVEMPEQDGFEAAKEFRARGYELPIIFITSHTERMQEAFEVNAFRYICKPLEQEEIIQALEGALEVMEKRRKGLVIKNELVPYDSILYIESIGDDSAVHLKDGKLIVRTSMKKWNSILPNQFFQCHQSYIVNMATIKKIQKTDIKLINNETVPMSVRKKAEAKERFFDYASKYAKYV